MLTEQRYELILRLLEDKKSITVAEVRDLLRTSESTVRRDITALDKAGKLTKVFGGAVAKNYQTFTPASRYTKSPGSIKDAAYLATRLFSSRFTSCF